MVVSCRDALLPWSHPSGARDVLCAEDGASASPRPQSPQQRGAQVLVIGDLSRAQARRFPQKTALAMGDEVLSYADLDARSNRLAHALRAEGLVPGDRVAL